MIVLNEEDYEEGRYYGLSDAEIEQAYAQYGPQYEAALNLLNEKGSRDVSFEELLAASSLGSPVCLWLRAQIQPEVLEDLHRRLAEARQEREDYDWFAEYLEGADVP